MKISMYHSDLISGFAFVCFNGEAYLLTIYFYYHRNILHPALRSCPGTEEGHSKYIFFWSWSEAEHRDGGAAAIWSLMTLSSVRLPQPSTERRMDTTCPSERERKLNVGRKVGWQLVGWRQFQHVRCGIKLKTVKIFRAEHGARCAAARRLSLREPILMQILMMLISFT